MSDIILNATSQDAILTYTCPLLSTPILIASGAGIEDRLSVEDAENVITEIGTDGTMSAHFKAVLLKGKLTLQPLAPALSSIRGVLNKQEQLKAMIPGTLTVESPSGMWTITYNNVIFTSKFKGFELGEKIKDVVIAFNAKSVNATVLGGSLSSAMAMGGLGNMI